MNPLDALATCGRSLAGNRTFGLDRPARPLKLAAVALVMHPAEITIRGLTLAHKTLLALLPATDDQCLGACADCGAPVTQTDPFIRYGGDYYHAHGCAETNPPALTRRRLRASLIGA